MEFELLSSRQNPRIKAAAALKDAAERKNTGLFLAEGARLCADAAAFGAGVQALFVTEAAAAAYSAQFAAVREAAENVYYITEAVAQKLADTASSQNFFCVCRKKNAAPVPLSGGACVVTDRVQNPENLGALSRSAEAFGAVELIVCGGCDIYAPKALRASMGALLRFPVRQAKNAAEEIRRLNESGVRTFAAVLSVRAADVRTVRVNGPLALVIGNEGDGVSPEAAAACTDQVIIPMAGRAESLNAAAAGAVLMWELFGRNAGNGI